MNTKNLLSYILVTDKRFVLLVAAVLFTLPFGWQAITNSILMLVLFNAILGFRQQNWRAAFISPLFIISALFFLWSLISLLWAENLDDGWIQMETKLSFFFAPLLIIAGFSDFAKEKKALFLKAFLFGSLAVCLAALGYATYRVAKAGAWYYSTFGPAGEGKHYYFAYENLSEAFMHPGYLSTYLGFAIFICIYFLVQVKGKTRLAYLALLFFFFVMMVMLQGRINILALLAVLGLGAMIIAIKKRAFVWLSLPLVPLVLLLIFMVFGSESVKSRYFAMPDFSYDISGEVFNSATYRLAEWSCAMDVIQEHPLAGTGIGDNRDALLKSYENRGFWSGLAMRFNAHNQYIETTIATGLVGLFFLLLLFGVYARLAFLHKDWLSLIALAFFAMCLLTESMLERAWAVLLFAIYFPVMLLFGTKNKA